MIVQVNGNTNNQELLNFRVWFFENRKIIQISIFISS